ncbi:MULTISPECIES: recombinase family protein [Peptoniphilus]
MEAYIYSYYYCIRKIFNWYLDGKSIISIVKELEKENY